MLTARATVWIAVFTVVLALVGIFTLYEVITGGSDTKKLADAADKQANIAASALCEAQRSAIIQQRLSDANRVAASNALAATIRSSQIDQRAWVGIDSIDGDVAVAKPFTATLTFKNSGKTFAKEFRADGFAEIHLGKDSDKNPLNFERERDRLGEPSLIMPNGEGTLVVHISGSGSNPYLTPPTERGIESLKSGMSYVFIHGRFEYRDVFHMKHWNTYCYEFSTVGWVPCNEHNESDNNGISDAPSKMASKVAPIDEPPACPTPPPPKKED